MAPSIENASSATASAPAFSYAQAAKGLLSTGTSTSSSRIASGAITPAKDAIASPVIPPQSNSVHDTDASKIKRATTEKSATEPQDSITPNTITSPKAQPVSNGSAVPPSPTCVESSVSTLPHEDDSSSDHKGSSESTWENLSTASHVAERGTEAGEHESQPEKGDKDWVKVPKQPQEAPMPIVNVWKQRMEAHPIVKKPVVNGLGVTNGFIPTTHKKADLPSQNPRGKDQDRLQSNKRDQRGDEEMNKPRRSSAKKFNSEEKPQVVPPPLQDQNIWPTVDIGVTLEERKRSQDITKSEKEKEKVAPKGKKQQWSHMEIQPSIVFQTPIHNPSSRRGGRGGGRGGRDVNSRSSPNAANGSADKRNGSPSIGEAIKRDREGGPRSTSPKGKRAASDEASRKESRPVHRENKDAQEARANGKLDEKANGQASQPTSAKIGFNKSNRRPDISNGDLEKRKDSKTQSDLTNGESATVNDDSSPKIAQSQPEEDKNGANGSENTARNFGRGYTQPFTGRNRGSVRGRGGLVRGSHSFQPGGSPHFQNQFGLTINHEQYFGAGNRTQARNGSRNQSLPPDVYPNRFGQMQNGGMVAPINTYMGQQNTMYDFSGQPMSALAYQPYLEQYQRQGSVAVQLEFYFTVDNLCRDIFLRKQMDSKGFVLLNTIANFNRIKKIIDGDLDMLRNASQQSHNIEYQLGVDGQDRIRKRQGWQSFVIADKAQRDESARHDGVEAQILRVTGWPHQMPYNTMAGQMSPNQPMSAYGMPSQGFGDFSRVPNGEIDFRYQMTPPMMNQQFQASLAMENQGFRSPPGEYPPNGMLEGQSSMPNSHPINSAANEFQPQQNETPDRNGVSNDPTTGNATPAAESNEAATQE